MGIGEPPPRPDPVRLASDWSPMRARRPPSSGRRHAVRFAKWILPAFALLLLSTIALWPELSRNFGDRVSWKRLAVAETGTGRMLDAHYRGVDGRGRPYTVTASVAREQGPEKVSLVSPQADVTLQSGTWLIVKAATGEYVEHRGSLDLSGGVTLYRADGTTVTSATATIDLKSGAGTSGDYTRAEGPWGTLDSEGFTLVDKGGVIQFHGPAKLVMNGAGGR